MSLDLWPMLFIVNLTSAAMIFAGGIALEYIFPADRRRSYRALAFNLATALIFLYLTAVLVPPTSALLDPLRQQFALKIPVYMPDGVIGSMLQTIAFFLIFDFFFYWWHRAQHRLHFLWVQHKFHHQEQWLNVTTVHRYHFSEEIFRVFVIFLPMSILFDFKPATVAWFWLMFTTWGYWIHLNVRVPLGPVGRWITGPQFHRLHHTPEDNNTNFAAFFSVWDRIFGTYKHPERGSFPQRTGVTGSTDGNTFYEAVFYMFVEWGRSLARVAARVLGSLRPAR